MPLTRFFKHPPDIDVEKENKDCQRRDPISWAFLISRLVDLERDSTCSEDDDHLPNAPHLRFYQVGQEAIVYRTLYPPPITEVLIFAHVSKSGRTAGMSWAQIVSEVMKRDKL